MSPARARTWPRRRPPAHLLDIKTLIGERRPGLANPFLIAFRIQCATLPCIARVVVDGVSVGKIAACGFGVA